MDHRFFSILLAVATLLLPLTAVANTDLETKTNAINRAANKVVSEPVIDPKIARRQVDESLIDVDDFEIGIFAGIMNIEDFGSNSLQGASLSYHINENIFAKAHYGQSTAGQTSFERLSGGSQLLTDEQRELSFYDVSLGYNFNGETFISQRTVFNSSLYLMLGFGSTEFAGDNRFTVNVGAGYRVILSDNFIVHVDMTDHIFDNDVLGVEKTTHNLAFTAGVSLFF
ncbi:outer membrane beta-barrel domain-containing protein [Psychrobium sp. 1_MG-2023]|uniref:outer membrane beta-barrel domain-containing protein n=1 Tax=Psychrobium sp. 1_MG-2023 TaxID=3062624 RepID=UPI000C34F7F5|nr:outer membrane beta-barrel domain-containing protein [Psychrobium sp. 1_MG-2023]MDP2562862.1 outer membrane beta-barrel domain-containing protein [Psychrobium sp. 1_MG-2023]PKF53972.1 outer membrane beta-barrel domain-containing protein [Alteromonadales bacterium alter-6D02]